MLILVVSQYKKITMENGENSLKNNLIDVIIVA